MMPLREWATKLLASENLALIDTTRLAAVNALAEEFRSDAKKASGAKGASGIYRRCANRIERAVTGTETPSDPVTIDDPSPGEPPENGGQPSTTSQSGFSDIAAHRLTILRHRSA
jgi:hypothetical protein